MLNTYNYAINLNLKVLIRSFSRCSVQSSVRGGPYVHPNPLVQPIGTARKFKKKHYNPKFRTERGQKMIKIDLPDFHKKEKAPEDMTPDEIRTKMKEIGIQPSRPWNEKPMFISSTGSSIDAYVPPEGDGKAFIVSKEGAKQKYEFVGKKGRSMMAVRKIRQFDEDFDLRDFVQEAQKIYVQLHEALTRFDEDELHKFATERAYPLVTNEIKNKTIRWSFHGSLEPPRAVHVRYIDIITKDNLFAQVTVRFHSQQTLAVYDRFGRLVHGSECVLKDVLEYVVFEKHLSNLYGTWRIHDKIIPTWLNLRPTSLCTFKAPKEEPEPPSEEPPSVATEVKKTPDEAPALVPAS